jgi:hypothetical protein
MELLFLVPSFNKSGHIGKTIFILEKLSDFMQKSFDPLLFTEI